MVEVVGIRFRNSGKMYYFAPGKNKVKKGDMVLVETVHGVEYCPVLTDVKSVEDSEIVPPLKEIIRIATKADAETFLKNCEKEKEAYKICKKKIAENKLEMKLINAEYTFDLSKLLFYFTADTRIDFRDLVKELATQFRTRIELRQVGVRDEAKTVGGLGICGRVLCCHDAMGEFQPVSIKMAKEQGLSLNPTKISGTCGRLMCCLKYEEIAYEDALKRVPGVDSLVETKDGKGVVVASDLLRENVSVRLGEEDDGEPDIREYKADDIKILKKRHGSAHNVSAQMGEKSDEGAIKEN